MDTGSRQSDDTTFSYSEHAARLRSVVETAADGIITIDEHCIIDSINPAGARMFGYQPPELIGRNVSMLMPRPYSIEHDGYVQNYLTTGIAKIIGIGRDLTALRKDGSTFPMRLAVSEMILNGRRHFTGIISDTSDRRRLERQVLETAAAEQRRIGQDLHDGLCQQLAALGLSLERIKRKTSEGVAVEPAQFERIQQLVQNSIADLRQVAHGLQPVNFRVGGLPHALGELADSTSDRFNIICRARCSTDSEIEDQVTADHLYRIAQEATGNAVKHGKATHVLIRLRANSSHSPINLTIFDNGIGLLQSGSPTSTGMGLRIMKYRADAIGADFRIRARRKNRGTAVSCTLSTSRA
jgi:PAS domain S-box-containing protein